MSNEYKEWLKEQTFESLANDNLRIKLELKTTKEENEKLSKKVSNLEFEISVNKSNVGLAEMGNTLKLAIQIQEEENLQNENKRLRNLLGKPYKKRIDLENIKLIQQNKQMREFVEFVSQSRDGCDCGDLKHSCFSCICDKADEILKDGSR